MPPTPPAGPSAGDPSLPARLRELAAQRGHQRAFSFVEFPDPASPGVHRTVTWKRLYERALAIGERLAQTARPGDRAALLLPQGLDYVAAFLGCLYARVVAVPLFSPDLPGHAGRLAAVLDSCEPACVLSDTATAPLVERFHAEHGTAPVPLLCVDRLPAAPSAGAELPPDPDLHEVAYLQYTSGSTRVPAGVMITHGNVVANARQAVDAYWEPGTCVSWLPLFHDMGLVLSVAAPVVGGLPSVLMDPISFLEQPVRWLRLLGAYPATVGAAPNFAYDYCASRIDPQEAAVLRLDRVHALINGAEPIRPGTLERFQEAFADAGLRPEAMCPSYGLAEATVFVTTDPQDVPVRTVVCDRAALGEGRIVAADAGDGSATALVACGAPVGQELRVVSPEDGTPLPEGVVGEILLRGPNIGLGYWKRPEASTETFGARVPGEGDEPWLRTGDLGAMHEGRLLVTGRLKDLVIADGRNHYPQDIEETIQSGVDSVRRDRLAVFSVPGGAGGEEEQVIAVAEYRRDVTPTDALRVEADSVARARVSAEHGLRLSRVLLVPPGSVPRTSSGKVSRSACRARYLDGGFGGESGGEAEGR
ncbi:fatty acyl-AMP ligase [Streptomyces sp. B1866]|uniref:fatty acyl-AMP ligase n=1 Tax=Streptomyces sp. B1866 TaxID=3075431 RepID=UPI0028924601|nr:fatty acyl-AMP ligase [Streptomyces sp. B1866]MDT3396042.1 fatty acyl-AMP ligase [Streptomyces sp. B1866]